MKHCPINGLTNLQEEAVSEPSKNCLARWIKFVQDLARWQEFFLIVGLYFLSCKKSCKLLQVFLTSCKNIYLARYHGSNIFLQFWSYNIVLILINCQKRHFADHVTLWFLCYIFSASFPSYIIPTSHYSCFKYVRWNVVSNCSREVNQQKKKGSSTPFNRTGISLESCLRLASRDFTDDTLFYLKKRKKMSKRNEASSCSRAEQLASVAKASHCTDGIRLDWFVR